MSTGFQPFLIGKYSTGLFNYLTPWQSPEDSFRELQNSYIFRGTLNKRNGYAFFGVMTYRDNGIGTGNNTTGPYTGTLSIHPIIAGTFTPTDGIESFTDDGLGVLTGSAGGTGTINYTTGAWSLTFGANVPIGTNIDGIYSPNLATPRPIMFIETFFDEDNDQRLMMICDTDRAAVYNPSTKKFDPLSFVQQQIWQGNGTLTTITVSTGWVAVAPYASGFTPFTISITDGTSTIIDDGAGNLSASGNFAAGGTVNYATGSIVLNFTAAPASTVFITLSASLSGDYFTGSDRNFFNGTNWMGNLYFTNNVNRITTFDGINLARPAFPITQADQITYTNDISTCIEIEAYKNRLLLLRPTRVGQSMPDGQSIIWSAINQPTNMVADVAGNGGELSAPTDDWIQTEEFLRDQLVVNFEESTWLFQFTGNDFDPFRWVKINSTKSCNAPYGSIPYDDQITAMGAKGLISCDGVNVERYDLNIVDSFLSDINQEWFEQCFGIRFDSQNNQSWMLYPSNDSDLPLPEQADKVLIFNFLENTWATYVLPMSCLGTFNVFTDATWDDFAPGAAYGSEIPNWESATIPWDYYQFQSLSPSLFGGGHDGKVYQLDFGETDNGEDIPVSILSTRWNPFSSIGQRTNFGWIDFYYQTSSRPDPIQLKLEFFTNNSSAPSLTRILTLDGYVNSDSALKRIYINLNGEFIQMKISVLNQGTFQINGMVLWAASGGRFTPGLSV